MILSQKKILEDQTKKIKDQSEEILTLKARLYDYVIKVSDQVITISFSTYLNDCRFSNKNYFQEKDNEYAETPKKHAHA